MAQAIRPAKARAIALRLLPLLRKGRKEIVRMSPVKSRVSNG